MEKSKISKSDSVILIDALVLQKMFKYAQYAFEHFDSEIAGWAHYNDEEGVYKTAPLTKQKASRVDVDNFPNDILEMEDYDMSDMMVQWHSHIDMNVFWSGTDEKCITETLELTKTLISIVVNIFGEYKCRVDSIVIGRNGHTISVNKQITQDCILQPYYKSRSIEREVLKNLSHPEPVTKNVPTNFINQSEDAYGSSQWAYNPSIGDVNAKGQVYKWDPALQKFGWCDDDKSEDDLLGSTDRLGSLDSKSYGYWIKKRNEFINKHAGKVVEIGWDATTNIYVFSIEGHEDLIIEWGQAGIVVNNISYTLHQLEKKLGLKI